MLRLILLSLFLVLPAQAVGQVIKLPAEIVATGKLVVVKPEYDTPAKVLQTEFVVFGEKSKPEWASFGDTLLIAEPDADDVYTVVSIALFEGPKLSKAVTTRILPRKAQPGGTKPPTTNPGTTPTTPAGPDRDIAASATGLNVIIVLDPAAITPELAALGKPNLISQALTARRGVLYVRNATDSLITPLQPSIQGKALPVLVVIDGNSNPRKVLAAESFSTAGTADQIQRRLITQIANASGK